MQKSLRLTFFLTLMLISEAYMSEDIQEINLHGLVQRSESILLVKKDSPYLVREIIKIDGAKKVPDYVGSKHRYKIVRILMSGSLKAGRDSTVEAIEAFHETKLDCHRRYYLDGVSKIPVYESYTLNPKDVEKDKEFIIFLTYDAKKIRYEFAAEWSFERKGAVNKVLALVKSRSGDTDKAANP